MKEFSIQKDIGKDHIIIITGLNCPGSAGASKDGHAITLWRIATWLTAVKRGHCPIKRNKFEFGQKKFGKKSRNGEQRSRRRNKVKGPPWFDGPLSFA